MAIAINGSGTVTGISVGGLPDGIVDTDMLANNAVTSAKSSGLGTSTRICSSNTTLSSQANVDYTGFSSTLKRFDIHISALSTSGANFGVRLGTGGTLKTSGHNVGSGYIRSSSNVTTSYDGGFLTYGLNDTAYSNNGYFTFTKVSATENKWWCRANISEYGTGDHWFVIFGYVTLTGTLDIISVLAESGNFDSGNLRLVTYSD